MTMTRLRDKPQVSDRFDMGRLRKQIKPPQAFQYVLPTLPLRLLFCRPRNDLPNVPRLRMHVAAHVHDGMRAKCEQLPYERLIASLAWRIDDERGAGRGKIPDAVEDLCRLARAEGDFIRETIERCVVRREADRVRGELDACDLCEVWGQGQCEEACAAVGVHEVSRGQGARRGCGSEWEDSVADA